MNFFFLPYRIYRKHMFSLKCLSKKYLLERSEVSCPAGGRVIQAGIFPIQHQIDTNGAVTLGIRGLRLCSGSMNLSNEYAMVNNTKGC